MEIWFEILKLGASGDGEGAREVLDYELTAALRQPFHSHGRTKYRGPLPERVSRFIAGLPDGDREMARSREDDLIGFVLAAILNQVRRSLLLVEFCRNHPDFTFDQVAASFTGWEGLKRNELTRRKLLADLLRSMLAAGIQLPNMVVDSLGQEGEAAFRFSEIGLVKRWDVAKSWLDFKRRQELDYHYKAIDDSNTDSDPEANSEGLDFGVVSVGEVSLSIAGASMDETSMDFKYIGRELSPDVTGLMERMHSEHPVNGYRPIAWHNVFWKMVDEFGPLELELETLDPEVKGDQALAAHISENYKDVLKPNRLNIQRRRDLLKKACWQKVFDQLVGTGRLNNPASRSHM